MGLILYLDNALAQLNNSDLANKMTPPFLADSLDQTLGHFLTNAETLFVYDIDLNFCYFLFCVNGVTKKYYTIILQLDTKMKSMILMITLNALNLRKKH